jgi:hypothetical protein
MIETSTFGIATKDAIVDIKLHGWPLADLFIEAYAAASLSPERTQCGSLVVGSGVKTHGYNQVVPGSDYCIHAEEDSLLNFPALIEEDTYIVCPWYACCKCATLTWRSGIKHAFRHAERTVEKFSNDWWEDIKKADAFLEANGVTVHHVSCQLDIDKTIQIRHKAWSPKTGDFK